MAIRRDEANLVLSINGQQAGTTLRDLESRARDLKRQLSRLPVDSDDFKKVAAELKSVNQQLLSAREQTKAVSAAMSEATTQTGGFRSVMQGVLSVFGGLNLQAVVQQLFAFAGRIFDIATGLDGFRQKTQTVFGEATSIVNGFAETNARSLGLARQEYINLATSAGDLIKPMGFTEEATAKLSVALVDQAGVLAQWSKGKVDSTQAAEILQKALLGERDALNTLGIDIKDSLIQDELKAKGLDKLTGESRRQAEALITLEQITKQSASANEAFAENTDKLGRTKAELRAKVQEAFQVLAERFLPIINRAASVVGPLVNWIGQFVVRLVQLADRAKVFNYLSATFNALGTIVSNVIGSLGSLADGLVSLFEGDFGRAWEKFKSGTSDLFSTGFRASESFIEGWKSKDPLAFLDDQGAAFEASGNNVGKAFAGGFDKEFEALKKSGDTAVDGVKKSADAAKGSVSNLRSEIEKIKKEIEQAPNDQKVLKPLIDELARAEKALKGVEDRIERLKNPQQDTAPALGDLADITAIFGDGASPTNTDLTDAELLNIIEFNDAKLDIEQQAFNDINALRDLDLEKEGERWMKRLEMEEQNKEDWKQARLSIAESVGNALIQIESRNLEQQTQQALTALDREYQAKIAAAEGNGIEQQRLQRELEQKKEQIELQAARKRKAIALKEAVIQGALAVVKALPNVAAAVAAGIAAAAQIAIIAGAKFAGGGFTGTGKGRADETGHVPVGVVHANEWVSPPWMTKHPVYGQYIQTLESVRRRGYAEGGFTTTPALPASGITPAGAADTVIMGLVATVGKLEAAVSRFPRELRARVAYTEIEDVGKVLGDVRNEAAL